MSIETMMTLGVAGVIFVAALLVLGLLTLVTRLSLLVLRPTVRGTSAMARRHAPTARAALVTWGDRLETNLRERALPAIRAGLMRLGHRVSTDYREKLVPAVRDRAVPAVRDRAVPAVRQWFTGHDVHPALAPARQRHRRA